MALAAALAFGLGGQNVAGRIVEQGYEKSGEARQQVEQQQRQNRQQQGDGIPEDSSEGSFARVDSGRERPDARRLDR